MELRFEEQAPHTNATRVTTTTWAATPSEQDTFLITRITLQDLINMTTGKVNFVGYEKPKLGTLEELSDVFTAAWLYTKADGSPGLRPLVGNFHGGFPNMKDAAQMCVDTWRQRERFQTPVVLRVQ